MGKSVSEFATIARDRWSGWYVCRQATKDDVHSRAVLLTKLFGANATIEGPFL